MAAASRGPAVLKISFKAGGGEAAGGRQTSFLGEYDRELDEHPEEPLAFEEQFILRVPQDVADGRGDRIGLRDLIKGKGKGLEGVEFKMLGEFDVGVQLMSRPPARCVQDQRQNVLD